MATYAIVLNGTVLNLCEWDGVTPWAPDIGIARLATLADKATFIKLPPTDDEQAQAIPRKVRLAVTSAAGKAALKDMLDEQIAQAQAWEWFNTKIQADAVGAAAKTAVQNLANAEYTEAKRLAVAWNQAT